MSYKNKYIKYKLKYLNLCNIIIGGSNSKEPSSHEKKQAIEVINGSNKPEKQDKEDIEYQFIDIQSLQIKTGRDYSDCQIINDFKKIKEINDYLKTNSQTIPKIIHQIWIGPKKIPFNWINSFRQDFMKQYTEWKYYLWTEKDVNNFDFQNKEQYDNEKSYHGKSDILRYEILYKYGGIYIDADSQWLGLNLSDLIKETNYTGFFIGKECKECKDGLANGILGSSVKNPITGYIIQMISENYFKCNQFPPYKTTGPYLMDQILYDFDVTIFPYYYFYPIYWHGKKTYEMSIEEQKKNFPNSYITQFGYTTNNLDAVE